MLAVSVVSLLKLKLGQKNKSATKATNGHPFFIKMPSDK